MSDMKTILDRILETKHKEVAERRAEVNISECRSQARAAAPTRDFHAAMTKPNPRGLNLIAEIKKASPSKGLIRPDFDPPRLAKAYAAGGADALSVLTDEPYFQGSLEYLRAVRQAVDIPLLRKDFIVDEIQLLDARLAGADAVLLIAAALPPERLAELMSIAAELQLAVLLEVHSVEEYQTLMASDDFQRAQAQAQWLLGVNNRDLHTFAVDIETTRRVAEVAGGRHSLISESGVSDPRDIAMLKEIGVRGVLVGETFMRQADVTAAVKRLFGETDG